MALQELEEEHRKRVAAAKKYEANLMDNRTLFNYSSSELILLNDRGLDRSQQIVQDWFNSFPPSTSLIAASEIIFSHRDSETAEQYVQGIAVYNSPENSSNFAENVNHLELQYLLLRKMRCIGNKPKLHCCFP